MRNRFNLIILVLAMGGFNATVLFSQPINAIWGKSTIASTDYIKADRDANVFRTSFMDTLLVKMDADGNVLWSIGFPEQPVDSAATIFGLSVDTDGNAIIAGSFKSGKIQFGTTVLHADTTGRHSTVFLVKYNSDGLLQWATIPAENADAIVCEIETDSDNNIYLSGNLGIPTTSFGSTNMQGGVFHVKLDEGGVVTWAKNIHSDVTYLMGLEVDQDGNTVVMGNYQGNTCTSGTTSVTNSGTTTEIYIAKFTPSGNVMWLKSDGTSTIQDWGVSLTVDPSANVYITGIRTGNSMFIEKLDANGNHSWENLYYNSSSSYYSYRLCTDPQGNVYLNGFFNGTQLDLGSVILTAQSTGNQLMVISYATDGSLRWAGISDNCIGEQIESDYNGHIYISGNMNGHQLGLGSVVLNNLNQNGNSRFIAKLSQDNIVTGITSVEKQYAFAIPNPTKGKFLIDGLKQGQWTIAVHGVTGQFVYSSSFNDTRVEIDLSSQKKGLYLFQLSNEKEGVLVGKIMVE